jgi:hypothetical protein
MPDRVIRDELLRSHRYRTLSSDTTRLLFVHLLLHADSLGNCEAHTTALGDAMGRQVDEATAAKWLDELSDVDLIRVYVADKKRYCHIPRFRQRLRYPNGKHPRPPSNIECSEIRELAQKVRPRSDSSQTVVGPQSAEVKRSEVKRSEENKTKSEKRSAAPTAAPATRLPEDWRLPDEYLSWAVRFGMQERKARITAADFKDYWIAKNGTDAMKRNWFATWRRWVRTTMEKAK